MRVLFVCLGNICRSVTAQHVFETLARRAGLDVEADSAGLIDFHAGEPADARMQAAAARRGYRLTHRSRPVTAADFDRFDLILGMDSRNVDRLRRLAPTPEAAGRVEPMAALLRHHDDDHIPDPYYGCEADFDRVVELLEDAAATLVERLRRG